MKPSWRQATLSQTPGVRARPWRPGRATNTRVLCFTKEIIWIGRSTVMIEVQPNRLREHWVRTVIARCRRQNIWFINCSAVLFSTGIFLTNFVKWNISTNNQNESHCFKLLIDFEFLFVFQTLRGNNTRILTARRGAPEEFENATVTGHLGFMFEENSVRKITWLSWCHRFRKSLVFKMLAVHTYTPFSLKLLTKTSWNRPC